MTGAGAPIVSDTHVGAWTGEDIMRHDHELALLTRRLDDVDEVVSLGDLFEFVSALRAGLRLERDRRAAGRSLSGGVLRPTGWHACGSGRAYASWDTGSWSYELDLSAHDAYLATWDRS